MSTLSLRKQVPSTMHLLQVPAEHYKSYWLSVFRLWSNIRWDHLWPSTDDSYWPICSVQLGSYLLRWRPTGSSAAALSSSQAGPKWIDLTWIYQFGSIRSKPEPLTHTAICWLTPERAWALSIRHAASEICKCCACLSVLELCLLQPWV